MLVFPALKKPVAISLALAAAAAVAACGTPRAPSAPPARPAVAAVSAGVSPLRPVGEATTSSTVVLARNGEERLAFIADEDSRAIITVDLGTKRELATTPIGGTPGQLLLLSDGRLLVTLRDGNRLLGLQFHSASAPLTKSAEVSTPAEPIAIAIAPGTGLLLVSSGWGKRLTAFHPTTLASQFEVKLPREPRAIAVSDDGKTAFVSHAVGSVMSKVDLEAHTTTPITLRAPNPTLVTRVEGLRETTAMMKKNRAPALEATTKAIASLEKRAKVGRESCQGFVLAKSTSVPDRIFAPQVMVDPGDIERRTSGYGEGNAIPEVPAVAVIEEAAGKVDEASMLAPSPRLTFRIDKGVEKSTECLLPRAAAIDPKTKSLLVACFGVDAVVSYDTSAVSPVTSRKREWNVGAGPTGIAIDAERRQAFVFSQFDRTLTTLPLGEEAPTDSTAAVEKITLAHPANALSTQLVIGRLLFHASGDVRISSDGRACASCHPDGRDDAITWATPDGPRRSILLAGRLKSTPPYSWEGNAATVQAHLGSTMERLRGRGLRSFELEALVAYISNLPAPPARTGDDPERVARGKAIFASHETGCASCHSGASMTDGTTHDVKSQHNLEDMRDFNTPSLQLVGGSGPWFHDGRYATLGELLKDSDGKMGRTKHLSPADLQALESYIETL